MTAAPAVRTIHGASRSGVAWSLSGTGAHRSTWGQVHRAGRATQEHGSARKTCPARQSPSAAVRLTPKESR